ITAVSESYNKKFDHAFHCLCRWFVLGVLLVGIAFKNIPFMSGLLLLDKGISDVLRKAAFSIILIRIAMGFDTGLFRKANVRG
uniref:Uncharacterized protein n=1 Tax=Parascaris equorum TaxID=6256 RepID=A0A914RU06_PAREQ